MQVKETTNDLLRNLLTIPPEGPLNGIMVVEIGQHVSGPMTGERLARNGALVIKIEQPGSGDPARTYLSMESFTSLNAAKLSIAIEKKDYQIYSQLLELADVIVDNRSPEAKEKDETLNNFLNSDKKSHPIIFCSIVGFEGKENKHLLALDVSVQAATGMAVVNGSEPDQPLKVGFVVLDEATAMQASEFILSHLFSLARGNSPKMNKNVIRLEVSMANVSAYLLSGQYLSYEKQKKEPTRSGNRDNWLAPFSFYPTRDSLISLAVINEDQYKRLCLDVLENKELLDIYPKNQIRMEKIAQFENDLIKILLTKESKYWLEKCQTHKVPASNVNSVSQALSQPFFNNVFTHTSDGTTIVRNPTISPLYENKVLHKAPVLDEHRNPIKTLLEEFNILKLKTPSVSFNELCKLVKNESKLISDEMMEESICARL